MIVMPRKRSAARLAVGVLLTVAPAGLAGSAAASPAKNYSMNSVNGEYAPPVSSRPAIARPRDTHGFAWGDAAAGAGTGALIVLAGLGGRIVVRRHRLVTG
jgi:hypothetical protein